MSRVMVIIINNVMGLSQSLLCLYVVVWCLFFLFLIAFQ